MPFADFETARTCLHENLSILADQLGNVAPENRALWNLSNALLVICDALQSIQSQVRRVEAGQQ